MARVLALFCSRCSDAQQNTTDFDKRTLRSKYEAIIADFGQKSSLILATDVVKECSTRNIKSLLRMAGPTISDAKSSPGTKINAIQLVTVIATFHDFYAKLVSKSGILKHVCNLARLKNGDPITRYFVNYSMEEVFACIIYARRTIGMLADLSYYKNVTDDVVPNGAQCLIHAANRMKSILMAQGISFSGDTWMYDYSRSNSVVINNNIASDFELAPMKSLGTKLKELEYHISLLQDEISQAGVLDGSSRSRDYTRIADFKSRLDFCNQQAQINLDAALETGEQMYCNDLLELLSTVKTLLDACSLALPESDTNSHHHQPQHQHQYQLTNGGDDGHTVATFDTTISTTRSVNNSGTLVSSVHSNGCDTFERVNVSSSSSSSLYIAPTGNIEAQIQIQVEEEGCDNYNSNCFESGDADPAVCNGSAEASINQDNTETNAFVADFGQLDDNVVAGPFTDLSKNGSTDTDVNAASGTTAAPSANVDNGEASDHCVHSNGLAILGHSSSVSDAIDKEPPLPAADHAEPLNSDAAAGAQREKVKEHQDIVEMLFDDLRLNSDPIDTGNVSQVHNISLFDSNVPLKSPDPTSTVGVDWDAIFSHKNGMVKNENSGRPQKTVPCSDHSNTNATDQVPTAKQEALGEDDWLNFCSDDDNINTDNDDKIVASKESVAHVLDPQLFNDPVVEADNDSPRATFEMIRNYIKSSTPQDPAAKSQIGDAVGIPNNPKDILNGTGSNDTNAVGINGTSQLMGASESAVIPPPLDSGPRYSNSDTVKSALVLSHGTLYKDSYVKVDFSLDRRVHERPMRIECSLEICNIGTRRFEHVQYNLTDFEHFPIHLVLGSEQLGTANKALAPKRTLCLSFDLYCLAPYMGIPKVSITLFIDGGKRRHLDLYLPIAMSRFAFPAACLHLSERLVTLPHKVYACIRGPRTHEIIEKAKLGGAFAAVDTGNQEFWYSCSFLECTDSGGTLSPTSEHFVLVQIEPLIEYDAATVSIYSDSYRLANALTQLYKYLFHQQQKQCE